MWSILPTPGLILVFDGALAIENLVGTLLGVGLIIWAIWTGASFLSRRLRRRTEPVSLPAPVPPSPDVTSPLNMPKEELFTLESNRMLGKITAEQYASDRASLEARIKLASGEAASDHIPAAPSEPPQQQAPIAPAENRFSPWFLIPLLAFPGFSAFMTLSRYGFSAESAGYWIGTLLVPFLVAYAVAGVKRRRNWERFTVWFFMLGIVLWGVSTQKSLSNLSRSDMAKELVGAKPLESNLPPNEVEMANAGLPDVLYQ